MNDESSIDGCCPVPFSMFSTGTFAGSLMTDSSASAAWKAGVCAAARNAAPILSPTVGEQPGAEDREDPVPAGPADGLTRDDRGDHDPQGQREQGQAGRAERS